jgi:UDP-N-acetylglucosamine 2-epimerase (non-hydrolysing)
MEALIASDKKIVVPLHPRTAAVLKKYNLFDKINNCTNIITIPPLGYLDFLQLLSNAAKVLTDSGGIQKEAFILKVPCITLRDNTEWVETVEEGWNILTGTDKKKITKMILDFSPSGNQCKVFGENASKKITGLINTYQGH